MSKIKNKSFLKQEIVAKLENVELFEPGAEIIGNSFSEFLKLNNYKQTVLVSKASELVPKPIFEGLIKGLLETGVTVIDIGSCPEPALYFVLNTHKAITFGIRATNEYLDKKFRGFKILTKKGKLQEAEAQEILAIAEAFTEFPKVEQGGYFSQLAGAALYSQGLIALGGQMLENKKIGNLKIIFDLREVPYGLQIKAIMREILEETAGKYLEEAGVAAISEVPARSTLPELQQAILREKADFGITYGEQGKQLIILDNLGEVFQENTLLLLAAREILKAKPGAGIIGATEHLKNYTRTIEGFGGKALVIPVEDGYVEAALENKAAIFGEGEEGHFFFADKYYGYPDALYATLRFLKIFSALKKNK